MTILILSERKLNSWSHIHMDIQLRKLNEVEYKDLMDLMNNPLVRRQMPLFDKVFTQEDCSRFITAKEGLWLAHGYGPWAFIVDNKFAGWGGLQPEQGEPDLALMLHPDYWGIGKKLYQIIIEKAFGSMGLDTITVLLPLTRGKMNSLSKLGFVEDGTFKIEGKGFVRYRLNRIKD